jgi:hypothetical protein
MVEAVGIGSREVAAKGRPTTTETQRRHIPRKARNGGGGGNRTHVRETRPIGVYVRSFRFLSRSRAREESNLNAKARPASLPQARERALRSPWNPLCCYSPPAVADQKQRRQTVTAYAARAKLSLADNVLPD